MPPLVLATVDDVRAALQDPGLDEAEARAAIDRVTDRIAGLLPPGVLDFVEHDTIELRGGGSRELRLPGPVFVDDDHPITVQEIGWGGLPYGVSPDNGWFRRGDVLMRSSMAGSSSWGAGWSGLPFWGERVLVTYSHGYREVPAGLKGVLLDAVQSIMINPQGLRSETVGQMTSVWAIESVGSGAASTTALKAALRDLGLLQSGAFSIVPGPG
ncbi:hypothetical protein [Kineosporia succinea]|uniref:Head-to-tail adaptor n=1 Tax=Kineosporia succinea TaxID=84632 RepID=A0ABT9PAD0_9ACTN|nr:hypothetical protein [Kineosporia succinea]MDP9829457.1 hypothetical protein [Kineosporia succinea]